MTKTELPAIVIQTTFLAANIACLLGNRGNKYILASTTLLMILFIVQATTKNERFWWLFPTRFPEKIPTPAWDTLILRGLIVASVVCFYIGVTECYGWPIVSLTLAILVIALVFPKIWDKKMNDPNENKIADKVIAGQRAMELRIMEIRPDGDLIIRAKDRSPRGRMDGMVFVEVKPGGSYAGLTYDELRAQGVGEIRI